MKKIKIIFSISLILMLFALSACTSQVSNTNTAKPTTTATPTPSSTPTEEEVNLAEYFPLAVDNSWTYEGSGNEYASYVMQVLYNKENKYQLMQNNGATIMANIIRVEKDMLVNTYREGEVYDNRNVLGEKDNLNIILLKLPLKAGNTWVSEENTYEIADLNAQLTVPAGTFDQCVKVKITYKDGNIGYAYYKKGIGLIQADFETGDGDVISSKLKSYTLK